MLIVSLISLVLIARARSHKNLLTKLVSQHNIRRGISCFFGANDYVFRLKNSVLEMDICVGGHYTKNTISLAFGTVPTR